MAELSAQESVNFLSMKSIYAAYNKKTGENVVFDYDGHLNPAGHLLLADLLYTELRSQLNAERQLSEH